MKWLKGVMIVAAMAMALPVMAGISSEDLARSGFDKLSEQQKAELLKSVVDKATVAQQSSGKTITAVTETVTPENVTRWADAGANIGKMLGGAAKEVGVAVNQFVTTPVGKMVMMLIIWNYMGDVIVHVAGGVMILVLGSVFIYYMQRRQYPVTYKYHPEQKDVLGRPVVIGKTRTAMDSDVVAGYMIAYAILVLISLVTMFTF